MRSAIEFIDMDREELNQLVERARASLSAEEYRKLKGVVEALSYQQQRGSCPATGGFQSAFPALLERGTSQP